MPSNHAEIPPLCQLANDHLRSYCTPRRNYPERREVMLFTWFHRPEKRNVLNYFTVACEMFRWGLLAVDVQQQNSECS